MDSGRERAREIIWLFWQRISITRLKLRNRQLLSGVMVERELPIHIIRLLWNLLKKKKLVFYVDGVKYMSRTGYKNLPQGSVLSSFLYSLLGSCARLDAESFNMRRCGGIWFAHKNWDCSCFGTNGMLGSQVLFIWINWQCLRWNLISYKQNKPMARQSLREVSQFVD
jgi:hypothetical protein